MFATWVGSEREGGGGPCKLPLGHSCGCVEPNEVHKLKVVASMGGGQHIWAPEVYTIGERNNIKVDDTTR